MAAMSDLEQKFKKERDELQAKLKEERQRFHSYVNRKWTENGKAITINVILLTLGLLIGGIWL